MERDEVEILLYGTYACFSKTYTRTDKISYPHITPSAAKGILTSIFRKPEFNWEITRISLLNYPEEFINMQLSEYQHSNLRTITTNKNGIRSKPCVLRNHILIKDPKYIVRARIIVPDPAQGKRWDGKYVEMFNKRIGKGSRCWCQPFFGMSDYEVFFQKVTDEDRSNIINDDADFGVVLHGVNKIKGSPKPKSTFFRSIMKSGTILTDSRKINILTEE